MQGVCDKNATHLHQQYTRLEASENIKLRAASLHANFILTKQISNQQYISFLNCMYTKNKLNYSIE